MRKTKREERREEREHNSQSPDFTQNIRVSNLIAKTISRVICHACHSIQRLITPKKRMLRPYIDVDRNTFLLTCFFFVNPCVEIQQWFLLLVKDVSVEKTNQNTPLAAVRRKRKKAS